MIWTFQRHDEVVRIETWSDSGTGEYIIVTTWSNAIAETERFPDRDGFTARVVALEAQLAADHWSQVGSPSILMSEGWRGPISH